MFYGMTAGVALMTAFTLSQNNNLAKAEENEEEEELIGGIFRQITAKNAT